MGDTADVHTVMAPHRVLSPPSSEGSGLRCTQGSYSPQRSSFVRLMFDNSYSRLNGKHVSYSAQVVGDDVLQVNYSHGRLRRNVINIDIDINWSN